MRTREQVAWLTQQREQQLLPLLPLVDEDRAALPQERRGLLHRVDIRRQLERQPEVQRMAEATQPDRVAAGQHPHLLSPHVSPLIT